MNQDTAVDIAVHLIQAHQYEQAESVLIPAIQNQRNAITPWQLLAKLSVDTGKYTQGLFAAWQANSLQPSNEMQALFAHCLNHVAITAHDPQLQTAVAHAIAESWGAPAELTEQASKLLKLDPLIQPHLQNTRQVLTGLEIKGLNQNRLLNELLQSAPVCDLELEHFLTKLRKTLLLNPMLIESASELTASLAQQCFINEYIYPVSGPETAALKELFGIDHWLILACYQPLHTLPEPAALLNKNWPEPLQGVIRQQIIEPQQEAALAAAMPSLTPINDQISQAVRAMYEESPYPRWVKTPLFSNPQPLNSFLAQNYPLSGFTPLASDNPLPVLIAGGGTGQHPLHTARRFTGAQVQVIDLSRRSLAYAQRKTQELGIDNLRFAQADILQIDQINETFDLIESVGVLHHMANPWAGWEALLTRLKPNGLMKLGFYSQTARKNINHLREFIKTEGFGNTPDAIRACRQNLIEHSQSSDIGDIFLLRDFYSTSACRDLLFHVQEHQLTLPEIEAFLQSHGLKFIGFETDANTHDAYRQQFPDDPAETNLSNWHQFEQDHPNTFISMYQFWLQKTS
jgi:2-polyprenyl-3-methyl-5-hydroxy-6-metoxy-1,4-benzoquinol methylase